MKNQIVAALAALICVCGVVVPKGNAQTAMFIYNDGNGTPNAGTYHPGDSFTFSINLAYTPGGTVNNLDGVSYWLQQQSPAGTPYNFAITLRDASGSQFSDLQSPGLTYPQSLNPSNANDLGGILPGAATPLGAGTYFVANITVSISPTAAGTGTFVLSNTLLGGKTSVISDSLGHTFAIPEADYTITMVPEPATWAAGLLLLGSLALLRRHKDQRLAPGQS